METLRTVGIAGLGIALLVALISANAAIALDRTALDSEFTKETAAEAELYGTFAEEFRSGIAATAPMNEERWPLERSREEILSAALTDEYVRSEGEGNIDALYAYLHGETDELSLEFDTEPLVDRIVAEVESDVETLELDAMMPGQEEIDMVPAGGEIETMASSRAAFEDARAEFRADRKAEIQRETERDLGDKELEARLEASMDDIRDEMIAVLDARLEGEFEGSRSDLEEPVRSLQLARINALTGEATYEGYTETVESERTELEETFVGGFESEVNGEYPDSIEISEGFGEEQTETLETAQRGVSIVSALAFVLPVVALMVAGGIGYLASRSIAAIEIGAVSLLSGGIGVFGSILLDGIVADVLETVDAPPAMDEFGQSFVTGILSAVTVQSVILVGIGFVSLGVGMAIRWDYL